MYISARADRGRQSKKNPRTRKDSTRVRYGGVTDVLAICISWIMTTDSGGIRLKILIRSGSLTEERYLSIGSQARPTAFFAPTENRHLGRGCREKGGDRHPRCLSPRSRAALPTRSRSHVFCQIPEDSPFANRRRALLPCS